MQQRMLWPFYHLNWDKLSGELEVHKYDRPHVVTIFDCSFSVFGVRILCGRNSEMNEQALKLIYVYRSVANAPAVSAPNTLPRVSVC